MASQYITSSSQVSADKLQQDIAQTSSQGPILEEKDEKFLNRHVANDAAPSGMEDASATKITDEGQEKETSVPEEGHVDYSMDQTVVPDTRPTVDENKSYDEMMREKAAERVKARKDKKKRPFDLPSQEEAEAATKGFQATLNQGAENSQNEKRTWISYLNSILPSSMQPSTSNDQQDGNDTAPSPSRTWKDYAVSYVPALPTPWRGHKDKDSNSDSRPTSPVYNDDGSINEAETQTKQKQEVSQLLDRLSLSQMNNRVFSFSTDTQKIYERFAQVLKDTINGGPTAYEDMEKLMREAGPKLEQQFKSMPPYVQTLVKSLPAKMGATLGPELLAAASEKPGADFSSTASGDEGKKQKKKKKRRIPGLKALLSKEGAVASMLRNVVNFLQARFPFLASATSVAMSLAVFILMFVFWYCHKRGKEVRLAREAEDAATGEEEEDVSGEEDDDDAEEEGVGDDGDGDGNDAAGQPDETREDDEKYQSMLEDVETKAKRLEQPNPGST